MTVSSLLVVINLFFSSLCQPSYSENGQCFAWFIVQATLATSLLLIFCLRIAKLCLTNDLSDLLMYLLLMTTIKPIYPLEFEDQILEHNFYETNLKLRTQIMIGFCALSQGSKFHRIALFVVSVISEVHGSYLSSHHHNLGGDSGFSKFVKISPTVLTLLIITIVSLSQNRLKKTKHGDIQI